jgi:hypothetical protein
MLGTPLVQAIDRTVIPTAVPFKNSNQVGDKNYMFIHHIQNGILFHFMYDCRGICYRHDLFLQYDRKE